jgi:hypothetical protein
LTSVLKPQSLLVLFLLFCVAMGLTMISFNYSHGDTKHLSDAELGRTCNKQPDLRYTKEEPLKLTKVVNLCLIDKVGLGIQVLAKINNSWEEITSYVNHQILSPQELLNYAESDMGKYGYFTLVGPAIKELITDSFSTQ